MAYVEISLLAGFIPLITSYIFHHFCVASPLPFCSYSDIVTVLITRIIQSTVESSPELLHAVAASASVWGAGSLQVLELTPASPVSTCTKWPASLRSAVLLNPRAYFTGLPSMSSPESCSSCLNGSIHTHPGEPRALHPGSLRKAWTPSTGAFSAWF